MAQKQNPQLRFSMVEYLCQLRRRLHRDVFESVTGRCSTCVDFINLPICVDTQSDDEALEEIKTHSFAINIAYLIQSAARAKCRICSVLSAGIMPVIKRHTDLELSNLYVVLEEKLCGGKIEILEREPSSLSEGADEDNFGQPVILGCRRISRYCFACPSQNQDSGWQETLGHARLFRVKAIPGEVSSAISSSFPNHRNWSYLPQRRRTSKEMLSCRSLDLVRYWINTCDQAHTRCRSKSTSSGHLVPDHLFDIGINASSELKLVRTHELNADYIALSYCWGATNTAPTTERNYNQRLLAISSSDLPQTYRDAILFARHLKIRYLWIDALCIVQDTDDFHKQMAKMGMIYQDAYVVIAADRAFNTDAGFLQHRDVSSRTLAPLSDAEESVVPPLVLENHDELHTIHSHFDTRNIMSVMNSMSISNPVFQRGWCLQERLLATRVLHVTAQELVWECRTTIDCECGRLEEVALNGFPTLRGNFGTLYANEAEETSNTVVHILLRNWHYIVQWYSGCDLSFAQDRLLAVSGVARRLQLPVFGQYLAGLWECELPQELAWRSIHDKTSTKYNTRDQVYVAPTWSWASVKGQVEWQDDEMTKVLINFAEVISVHCEPLDMDIFGCLQAGRLTLRTPVLKPLPRPPRKRGYYETTPPPVPNRIDCSLAIVPGRWEDISINAEIMLDVDQLSNSEQNESVDLDSILLAFLHCQSTAVHGGWRLEWRALAISPDPELQGVYRRVGLACSDYDPDVLKEGQKLSEWNGHETLPLAIDEVIPSALPEPAEDIAELENYLKGKQEQDDSPRPRRSPSLPPHLKTTATTRTTIGRKPFHSHIVNPHHALSDLKNMGALLRTITIM